MSYMKYRRLQGVEQLCHLCAHLNPQLNIQITQRFIQKDNRRFRN